MKRMLMLLPSVPCPPDSGARIRNHGLLKLLSASFEVDAIAFGDRASEAVLEKMACKVTVVPPPPSRSQVQRVADLARSDLPDMAQRLWSPALSTAVSQWLGAREYDAVQAEGIEMARYLELAPPSLRIYDAHNPEFLLQRRFAEHGNLPARTYSRVQWRRLERFERRVVQQTRLTLAVSQHDANQLLALAGPRANVQVVPNGISVGEYAFSLRPAEPQTSVLFMGKMDFRPNSEALGWFIRNVLPQVPGARLFAVGAAPPKWLVAAGQHNPRIAVTGYVENEGAYLARCAALVLPLHTAAGSRLKALVAMASGVPIVSTRLGMEGLEAEPGAHYLLAESPSEWIRALQCVLGDAAVRERLARSARGLVERRYDWSVIRNDLASAYAGFGE